MTDPQAPYVITIGRSFGSGGRALGSILARKLGIEYYDKELLLQAAAKAGMSPEYFEKNDERMPGFLSAFYPFSSGMSPLTWYTGPTAISADGIYRSQCDFIRELAASRPCIIVGRSADYVLRDHPNTVNVFVHAPVEDCVRRILERGECVTPEDARAMVEKTNKLRANYYNFYTDKRWGHAASYDLTFDSSRLPLETIADLIIAYLRARFNDPARS